MTWVDWSIVLALLLAGFGGLAQGFFRAVFSLGGLVAGIVLAIWNYDWLSDFLRVVLRVEVVADAVSFLVIVLGAMFVANLIGMVLSRTARGMGLGCLERLAGGFFGIFQGFLLIAAVILVAVAFFPNAHWLTDSRLPRKFYGMCHLSTRMSPKELAGKVRLSLQELEAKTPRWLHPGGPGQ